MALKFQKKSQFHLIFCDIHIFMEIVEIFQPIENKYINFIADTSKTPCKLLHQLNREWFLIKYLIHHFFPIIYI